MKHLYRHDLESLFYAIVFLVSRYDEGQEIENPPLQRWFNPGHYTSLSKVVFFSSTMLPDTTSKFEQLRVLLLNLRKIFCDGYNARLHHAQVETLASVAQRQLVPEFDESTLGGHVDFDKFEEILSEPMDIESAI